MRAGLRRCRRERSFIARIDGPVAALRFGVKNGGHAEAWAAGIWAPPIGARRVVSVPDARPWDSALHQQIDLGDMGFVEANYQARACGGRISSLTPSASSNRRTVSKRG